MEDEYVRGASVKQEQCTCGGVYAYTAMGERVAPFLPVARPCTCEEPVAATKRYVEAVSRVIEVLS